MGTRCRAAGPLVRCKYRGRSRHRLGGTPVYRRYGLRFLAKSDRKMLDCWACDHLLSWQALMAAQPDIHLSEMDRERSSVVAVSLSHRCGCARGFGVARPPAGARPPGGVAAFHRFPFSGAGILQRLPVRLFLCSRSLSVPRQPGILRMDRCRRSWQMANADRDRSDRRTGHAHLVSIRDVSQFRDLVQGDNRAKSGLLDGIQQPRLRHIWRGTGFRSRRSVSAGIEDQAGLCRSTQ